MIYHIMLNSSGPSLREAAEFHNVPIDTVKNWLAALNNAPPGAINEMQALLNQQERAAIEAHKVILDRIAALGKLPDQIELGFSPGDQKAKSLGWPSATAQMTMIGRLLGKLSPEQGSLVRLVPRGSTVQESPISPESAR